MSALSLACASMISAQIGLSKQSPTLSEDFNSMGDGLVLPPDWRVDINTVGPREIGSYADALTAVHFTASTNISATISNGAYSFASSTDAADRAVGGISTDAAKGNNTRSTTVMVALQNNDEEHIKQLTLSYDVEKYRYGSNEAGFTVQLYCSADGSTWTSAGENFRTSFAPDSITGGAEVVPIAVRGVSGQALDVAVQPGATLYLGWNIAATTGSRALTAQALAIDNVQLTASFGTVEQHYTLTLQPEEAVLVPGVSAKAKVLSMNNSLIEYNQQYNVFQNIAKAMGSDATWTPHTMLGQDLMTHYNSNDGQTVAAQDSWTHIILQEKSTLPRTQFASFRENVRTWVQYIREHCPNPNAIIIVPMNWALNTNSFADFTTQNATLYANHEALARELGVTICPVGYAYELIYENEGSDYMATLFTDDRHPSNKATYLAACMEYSLIFGTDPTTIIFAPNSVSDADAALMRQYAKKALEGYKNVVDHIKGQVTYTATVTDQSGAVVTDQQPLAYSTDSPDGITGNVFQAATAFGDYAVTALWGDTLQASAQLTVVEQAQPTAIASPMLAFSDGGEVLGQPLYNLAGQRISAAYKGVVIAAGRKRWVK